MIPGPTFIRNVLVWSLPWGGRRPLGETPARHRPAHGPCAFSPLGPGSPAWRPHPPGLPPPLDANDSQTSVSSPAVRLPPPTTTAQEPRCYAPLSQFSAPAQNLGVILDFSLPSPLPTFKKITALLGCHSHTAKSAFLSRTNTHGVVGPAQKRSKCSFKAFLLF